MGKIRLYVDEDAMSSGLVVGLQARGIDVKTVLDAGLAQGNDNRQLTYAAESCRVLYSFNVRDFCRIHTETLSQGRHHSGIIVVPRQRYGVGEQLRKLLLLIDEIPAEQMSDRLEFL